MTTSIRLLAVPTIYADPIDCGDELHETTALVQARAWRSESAPLLVLAGDVGTGKSLAAAVVLAEHRAMLGRANPWGRVELPAWTGWIHAPHLCRYQPWDPLMREIDEAPMLVLDDLGEEDETPRVKASISALLTTRVANFLPTIITTNVDRETFRSRYGERVVDRLRGAGLERGHARWWISCTGESLRGRRAPRPRHEEPEAPRPLAVVEPLAPERMAEMASEVTRTIESLAEDKSSALAKHDDERSLAEFRAKVKARIDAQAKIDAKKTGGGS